MEVDIYILNSYNKYVTLTSCIVEINLLPLKESFQGSFRLHKFRTWWEGVVMVVRELPLLWIICTSRCKDNNAKGESQLNLITLHGWVQFSETLTEERVHSLWVLNKYCLPHNRIQMTMVRSV